MTAAPTAPTFVVGLGCRRGCSAEELLTLIQASLSHAGITLSEVRALASIDGKRNEPGLIQLAQQLKRPLHVFSAQQLAAFAPGSVTGPPSRSPTPAVSGWLKVRHWRSASA